MDVAMTIPIYDLLTNISYGLISFAVLMSITFFIIGRQDREEAEAVKAAAKFERQHIDQPLELAANTRTKNPEEKARVFFRAVDRVMVHAPSVCGNKCSHCCYQAIDIFPLERPALEAHIKVLSDEQKAHVRYHAQAWVERYNHFYDLNPNYTESPVSSIRSDIGVEGCGNIYEWIVDEFSKTKVMCPFLHEHSCLIYPVRPVMCRDYVMSDSPSQCEESHRRDRPYEAGYISHQARKHLKQSGQAEPMLHALSDILALDVSMKGMDTIVRPDLKTPSAS